MISCRIDGLASITRVHEEKGLAESIGGAQNLIVISLVAEYVNPASTRDDVGLVSFTHMSYAGYSEN